ncbi:MAG: tRNA (adenosine(37)-N6)-threonylcarbamoyltransferase complex ATPase subunit type 1 TsaE [Gemmatimonadetes bacterium]|nr:tRNA (adenosine(37)-N6)-threonylcarbamoyltransferase complex ATPase subunit type 1 TsaE [Gemmatimonadota bacterium]MCC6770555.1 tRNA (adenosine(37)-N6)-threonylcarbamoyltransferase complex ATPase subunit type 1 TsaE [Gemmatimonadaceae bacterium]
MARLSHPALEAWGEALGRELRAPRVVTLAGEVGAGKTTLVQAICRGYGVHDAVTSPTFALVHEYAGAVTPVYHLDLYRLRDRRDLLHLGWDELMSASAIVLVEWPERAGDEIPTDAMRIVLSHVADRDDVRDLEAHG